MFSGKPMRACLDTDALKWTCTHFHCSFGCIHGFQFVLQLVLAVEFCPVMMEDCAIADACRCVDVSAASIDTETPKGACVAFLLGLIVEYRK